MGENHFLILIEEIKNELDSLKQLVQESIEFYDANKQQVDSSTNLRVFGSILHDFYTCIEKIFRKIAINIDEELPSDTEWHSNLLDRMNINIPKIRKRVIDDDLKEILYDYLRFRHIFRNIYGFKLNWSKMENLVESLEKNYNNFNQQITNFLSFLNILKNKKNNDS